MNPGPLGLVERTELSDLCALHHVMRPGPHKAALAARIRRHPDCREPDPSSTPQDLAASSPAPAREPAAPMSPAEVAKRRRFEVLSWTGEHLLDDQQ